VKLGRIVYIYIGGS